MFKFGNGFYPTQLGMWSLIQAGIKIISFYYKGPQIVEQITPYFRRIARIMIQAPDSEQILYNTSQK